MLLFIRHYLLAIQFFTRIPITGRLAEWVGFSPAMLRASAAHFPGVGVLVGLITAACMVGLYGALPAGPLSGLVAAIFSTVVGVLLTGAFHEDGRADVADGLGGSLQRERALEIMKDSRIGAFGAIALLLALLCKISLLALLAQQSVTTVTAALFLGHVVSRLWPLFIIRALPHVGDVAGSKSKPLADQISQGALAAALLWCGLAMWSVSHLTGVAAVLLPLGAAWCASALAWWGLLRWFRQRLQGFTGDCLGTTQQVCEITFYLGWAIALPVVMR